MKIINRNQLTETSYYGVNCQSFIKELFGSTPPFNSMICTVPPESVSTIHSHHEHECFFIIQGNGTILSQSLKLAICAGDFIQIDPFCDHAIENHTSKDILFISIWWEDLYSLYNEIDKPLNSKQTLILSAPPTPNGSLHLGHLSGPYIAADIYKRYLRLQNIDSFHACGRDDNQSYIVKKALNNNSQPIEVANSYSDQIEATLIKDNIQIDHYGKPNESKYHTQLVQKFFMELYEKGLIYEKESEALFCQETGKYLHEAHVSGGCPHCQSSTDGNCCEQCGKPNNVIDLISPISNYSGKQTVKKIIKRLFFKLSLFSEQLKQYHRQAILPAHLNALCTDLLNNNLDDVCVSHLTDWGINIPIKGYDDQRIYVWFEMVGGYLAVAQETAEKFKLSNNASWKYFFSNENTQIVHCFGFDNSYYHAILFPAVYLALEWEINIPNTFIINELLSLDGLKFSTSRGHLILGSDLLNIVPSDYLRYYLSYIRPETCKTNFTLTEFVSVIDEHLLNTWQFWLTRLFSRCHKIFNGTIPDSGAWATEHKAFFNQVSDIQRQSNMSYQPADFSPQRICRLANELVRESLRFSMSQEYYDDLSAARDLSRTGFSLEFLALKTLVLIICPIMPDFSEKMWNLLEHNQPMLWTDVPTFAHNKQKIDLESINAFTSMPEDIYKLHK